MAYLPVDRFRVTTSYLVNVLVSHREGECETQRKLLVLHVMVVQKVGHALCDVVKQLQRKQMRWDVKTPQKPAPNRKKIQIVIEKMLLCKYLKYKLIF